jgi:hypothetical protein
VVVEGTADKVPPKGTQITTKKITKFRSVEQIGEFVTSYGELTLSQKPRPLQLLIIALLGRLTLRFQMRPVPLTESGKGSASATRAFQNRSSNTLSVHEKHILEAF